LLRKIKRFNLLVKHYFFGHYESAFLLRPGTASFLVIRSLASWFHSRLLFRACPQILRYASGIKKDQGNGFEKLRLENASGLTAARQPESET
jgi:hypothetical protein